ncbi:hypothetical protein [Mucilaginibacter boryungensis]|uniref:DUF4251 domain-containing protein n=1 Tax=Mucilaginibacter boryungensis TaxID=768480 RepID=A0ABR9XJS2_9SPHI|nr:hypothetical protein [Mucilaginibacter boryungensis]MBE9667447.1 hypothetical protein [Mucilaginibacter boryungensis]
MKKYLIITFLLFCCAVSRAQTMSFSDLADLANLTLPQADNILIQTGKFKINNKEEVLGQILTHYQSIDKNKSVIKGESLVTGAYRTTGDGIMLKTITYKTVYPAYIDNLVKQIRHFGYRLTFTGKDETQNILIFDNQLNHITISKRFDGVSNSMVIRQKEIGVDQ